MTLWVYGNKVNVYIDDIPIGTQSIRDDGSIEVTIPKELVTEGHHIVTVDPVPVGEQVDSINNGVEIEGTRKGQKYVDEFRRVFDRSVRKHSDEKEEKLPKRFRRGW